jgi:hypothetical protein
MDWVMSAATVAGAVGLLVWFVSQTGRDRCRGRMPGGSADAWLGPIEEVFHPGATVLREQKDRDALVAQSPDSGRRLPQDWSGAIVLTVSDAVRPDEPGSAQAGSPTR